MYVTPDDVRATLAPDGADDQSTAAQMSDDALDREIVRAQAEVDGHLVDRYDVPFADDGVPMLIKGLTEDVAAYLATLTHSRNSALPENHPVWLRYSRASTLLERIGRSIIDLEPGDGDDSVVSSDPVTFTRDHDLFSECDLLSELPVYYP